MHVQVKGAQVTFLTKDADQLAALGPISFEIPSGQFVAIVGTSGSGKTTLIRALAGLQALARGQVIVGQQAVHAPDDRIGIMFQDATLMPWRTVYQNIALPLDLLNISPAEKQQRIAKVLPLIGLEPFAAAYPHELSGGMAQRVALGRLLVQQAQVVLLDEPFGALDAITREKISFDLLKIWRIYQQTVLMITHDIGEAILLADRVLALSPRPGQLLADIHIPLERPRYQAMTYEAEFVALTQQLRTILHKAM